MKAKPQRPDEVRRGANRATASPPADQAGVAGPTPSRGQALRVFTVTLVAKASPSNPGADPIRSLRWLLKIALRRFHLRCTSLREI